MQITKGFISCLNLEVLIAGTETSIDLSVFFFKATNLSMPSVSRLLLTFSHLF